MGRVHRHYPDPATGEVLPTWDQALDAIGPEDEPWHVAGWVSGSTPRAGRRDRRGGRAGGEDAELAGQPRLWARGQAFAERAGPVVERDGELAGGRRGGGGGALGPGRVVPQVEKGEPLQAVAGDAGDVPGPVHRRGGDLVDQGIDVVPGELRGAEPLVQGRAGVLAVVPPGFGFGEPGLDLLVDAGVQGLLDGGGPQGEQVPGSAGPFPRLTLPEAFTVRSTSITAPDAGGSGGGPAGRAPAAVRRARSRASSRDGRVLTR
jgi:hypothetical protein